MRIVLNGGFGNYAKMLGWCEMFIFDFVADVVLDQIVDWIYGKIISFLNDFFAMMNNMGVELFELPWIQAVTTFFGYLGWTLFVVGIVVGAFECAIEYQGGREREGYSAQLCEGLHGSQPVHGAASQSVFAVCVPAEHLWLRHIGTCEPGEHW